MALKTSIFSSKVIEIALYTLGIVVISYPFVAFLEDLPIRIWDESRLAISAVEMVLNKQFLITTFENSPDLWSTKPPLLIWIQALCIHFFGISELSVRLPSAIAAILTCVLLYIFSFKIFKNKLIGFISALVLVTTNGYVAIHGTRTADYDALLTLFTTCFAFLFFVAIEKLTPKFILMASFSLGLAVLTKSIAGLMLLPGAFIYVVLNRKFEFLKSVYFYLGSFIFLSMVLGYYISRENADSGYIEAVIKNELTGRYLHTIEGHDHSFWYYLELMYKSQYSYWIYLIPLSFIKGLKSKNEWFQKISTFNLCIVLSYFLVISIAKTKLEWYIIPIYPFLALQIAILFNNLIEYINQKKISIVFKRLFSCFIIIFLIIPYILIVAKIYKPTDDLKIKENKFLYDIAQCKNTPHKYKNINFFIGGYAPQYLFYKYLLESKKIKVKFKDLDNLSKGDTVWVYQENILNQIKHKFPKTDIQSNSIVLIQ